MGAYALALVAGIISFASPCSLPLMPGYVSYVSGVAGGGTSDIVVRSRVVASAMLFVAGFAMVFTLLGASASVLGSALLAHRQVLVRVAGLFVIAMGAATMGVLRIPILSREVRLDPHRIRRGPAGAIPLGVAFAIGWTPCIGPVLAGILTAAAATQTVWHGAALLFAYSLGLGIPFVLLAVGFARAARASGWLRRHSKAVERTGGAVLILMGVLMITGQWLVLFSPLVRWFAQHRWPPV